MKAKSEAEIFGEASYVSLGRENDALTIVARKLATSFVHAGYGDDAVVEPTEAELAALRHRYIENDALSKRSQWLWSREKWDPFPFTLAGGLLRLSYRLVVLSAAIVILYQFFGSLNF